MVRVAVARDGVGDVRVSCREEGGDGGRCIPCSASEARPANDFLRSNTIFFEGVAEHGDLGIGTLVLVLVVLLRFGRRGPGRSAWSTGAVVITSWDANPCGI